MKNIGYLLLNFLLIFALSGCGEEGECLNRPRAGTIRELTQVVRADGARIKSAKDGNIYETDFEGLRSYEHAYDKYGNLPDRIQLGMWQKLVLDNLSYSQRVNEQDLEKASVVSIKPEGSIYLKKEETECLLNFDAPEKKYCTIKVKSGDLIILQKNSLSSSGSSSDYGAIAAFTGDYYRFAKPGEIELSRDIDEDISNLSDGGKKKNNFISRFGYCRDNIFTKNNMKSYLESKFNDMGSYYPVELSGSKKRNCFHYDGRGIKVSLGNQLLKGPEYPFISVEGFVPSSSGLNELKLEYMNELEEYYNDKNNLIALDNEKRRAAENNEPAPRDRKWYRKAIEDTFSQYEILDFSNHHDNKISHLMLIQDHGSHSNAEYDLTIELDYKYLADAYDIEDLKFLGDYRIKVVRHTDRHINGERLQVLMAEGSIDVNQISSAQELLQLQNAGKIKAVPEDHWSGFVPTSNTFWFRVDAPEDLYPYKDRLDQYYVNIGYLQSSSGFTSIYNDFVEPLRKDLYNMAEVIYNRTVKDYRFQTFTKVLMTMVVIIYAMAFLMGTIREPQMDFVKRVLKIGFITVLLSENSWDFFHSHLFTIFKTIADNIIMMVSLEGSTGNAFTWMDNIVFRFFNSFVYYRMLAFIILGPMGLVFLIVLVYVLVYLYMTLIRIFLVYCILMICVAFLISISPIFIICLLFQRTYSYFDNWLKLTISLSFQPATMVIGVIVIAKILDLIANNFLGDQVCWRDAMYVYLVVLNFIRIKILTVKWWMTDWDVTSDFLLGISFNLGNKTPNTDILAHYLKLSVAALCLIMMVHVMRKFLERSENINATLFGTMRTGVGAVKGVERVFDAAKNIAKAAKTGGKKGALQIVQAFKDGDKK